MDYDIRKAIRDNNLIVAANDLYRKGEHEILAKLIIKHKLNRSFK